MQLCGDDKTVQHRGRPDLCAPAQPYLQRCVTFQKGDTQTSLLVFGICTQLTVQLLL